VNYRAGQEAAEKLAGEIGGVPMQGDVSSPDEARALLERVEQELGDVDALVNNAGVTRDTLIARMSDDDWETVIDTNLRGTFNTARAVSRKMMRRRSGSIVNISSVVGVRGNPGQANYAASKAGIIGLTKALARELGSRGVRVNAIAPGYIKTELTDVLTEEQRGLILANTPLARLGEPEDIAVAVRFLCSDEAAFITGEVLLVDGGLGT
jgi:3-oxoacyl-[acyl-carrier protein] reductase